MFYYLEQCFSIRVKYTFDLELFSGLAQKLLFSPKRIICLSFYFIFHKILFFKMIGKLCQIFRKKKSLEIYQSL